MIIGNVPGAIELDEESIEKWKVENECNDELTNVVTQQQMTFLCKESEKVSDGITQLDNQRDTQQNTDTNRQQQTQSNLHLVKDLKPVTQRSDSTLKTLQMLDQSLKKCWEMIDKQVKTTKNVSSKYVILKIVLHGLHQRGLQEIKQVVLPKAHNEKVFEMAHSTAFGGHMGISKTLSCIQNNYHWPSLTTDVKNKCKSCIQCQTNRRERKFHKATLQVTDILARPFEK